MSGETNKSLKKLVCAGIAILALAGIEKARGSCVDSNSVVQDGIEYYMQTDKSVYSLGENVEMLYRVTNLSYSSVTFEFAYIQQWFFEVRDGATRIWGWPNDVSPAGSGFTLQPGEFKGYFKEWDMMNDNTGTIVSPGTYDVIGALNYFPGDPQYVPVSVQIEIVEGPYCGDANHPYPAGDVNHDCKVNFKDFALIAFHWLECTAPECRGLEVTDVKIIRGELVEGWFEEIEEVNEVSVGDVFIIVVEVTNFGSEMEHVLNVYGWDLSPEGRIEVIGTPIICLFVYDLQPGESAFLYPFCLSQAFKAEQDGWVTMNIYVDDWYSGRLCEHRFTFEILPGK